MLVRRYSWLPDLLDKNVKEIAQRADLMAIQAKSPDMSNDLMAPYPKLIINDGLMARAPNMGNGLMASHPIMSNDETPKSFWTADSGELSFAESPKLADSAPATPFQYEAIIT